LFVAGRLKTISDVRASTGSQDLANQELVLLDHARQARRAIDRFVEAQASSWKGRDRLRIEGLFGAMDPGDRSISSELFRPARSLERVISSSTVLRRHICL
jgi:hypothetical protein